MAAQTVNVIPLELDNLVKDFNNNFNGLLNSLQTFKSYAKQTEEKLQLGLRECNVEINRRNKRIDELESILQKIQLQQAQQLTPSQRLSRYT